MRKLSLIPILGVVLALSAGAAAAATPASLSSAEYQKMLTYQTTAAARSLKSLPAVEAAQKSCLGLSPVSGLLRAARDDCKVTFSWIETSFRALLKVKSCSHTNIEARFACLMSSYVRLAAAAGAMYHADDHLYLVVKGRGFTGACARALSDGPKAISYERQMSVDLDKMIAAMRTDNLLATQKWGSLYDAATAEGEAAAPKESVLVCPHVSALLSAGGEARRRRQAQAEIRRARGLG